MTKGRAAGTTMLLVFLLGWAGPQVGATGKTAGDHQGQPTPVATGEPEADCPFEGNMVMSPGLSDTPTHNHYELVSTDFVCLVAADPSYEGRYDAAADGETDGPDHLVYWDNAGARQPGDPDSGAGSGKGDPDHGEDCDSGWSRGPGALDLRFNPSGDEVDAADIEFVRTGTHAVFWGELPWGARPAGRFYLEATVTPAAPSLDACQRGPLNTSGAPKITDFEVSGVFRFLA